MRIDEDDDIAGTTRRTDGWVVPWPEDAGAPDAAGPAGWARWEELLGAPVWCLWADVVAQLHATGHYTPGIVAERLPTSLDDAFALLATHGVAREVAPGRWQVRTTFPPPPADDGRHATLRHYSALADQAATGGDTPAGPSAPTGALVPLAPHRRRAVRGQRPPGLHGPHPIRTPVRP